MTTPNEELIADLRDLIDLHTHAYVTVNAAADLLQSQAEHIKELEAAYRKELDEVSQRNYELRKENDTLRAQLAVIAATEPVWFHKVGVHGEHRFYNQAETQPEGCTPLFTSTMLAQDVTELVGALEDLAKACAWINFGDCRAINDRPIVDMHDAYTRARTALSKYKGAK